MINLVITGIYAVKYRYGLGHIQTRFHLTNNANLPPNNDVEFYLNATGKFFLYFRPKFNNIKIFEFRVSYLLKNQLFLMSKFIIIFLENPVY